MSRYVLPVFLLMLMAIWDTLTGTPDARRTRLHISGIYFAFMVLIDCGVSATLPAAFSSVRPLVLSFDSSTATALASLRYL